MNFNTIKLAIKNNAGKYITKGVAEICKKYPLYE